MALNEQIVEETRYYRQCVDKDNKKWERYGLWNRGKDTECEDGNTVETKVGAIKGITTSTNVSETGYAADAKTVSEINQSLTYITSQDVVVGTLNGKDLHRRTYNLVKADNLQSVIIDTSIKAGDVDYVLNIYGTFRNSLGNWYSLSHQSSARVEVLLSYKGVELVINNISVNKMIVVIEYTLV